MATTIDIREQLRELSVRLPQLNEELQELMVTEVEETGREPLGSGSYGVVKELKVKGHRYVCVNQQS